MIKNLILLAVAVAWVSSSYAKTPVVQEDMKDVESFKVEKPEQERKREVAGGKQKSLAILRLILKYATGNTRNNNRT